MKEFEASQLITVSVPMPVIVPKLSESMVFQFLYHLDYYSRKMRQTLYSLYKDVRVLCIIQIILHLSLGNQYFLNITAIKITRKGNSGSKATAIFDLLMFSRKALYMDFISLLNNG